MNKLEKMRQKMNKIDENIAKWLRARAKQVTKIKELKRKTKLPIIDKNREKDILNRFKTDYEKEIFKKIISESRRLQQTKKTNL